MDCHHRELDIEVELPACHNDAQLTKARTCHGATATALQWAHLDSVSTLNHEVVAEER